MPRATILLCTTIVAAFHVQVLASGAVSQDVPVPGGTAAVARALGVTPAPDPARFVAEIARLRHVAVDDKRKTRVKGVRPLAAAPVDRVANEPQSDSVPIPLTVDLWSRAVLRRPVPPSEIVTAILSDSRAAHLCYGLAALDDETLAYFSEHSAVLRELYESAAAVFAAFAGRLRIADNRVVVPGGAAANALWEAVVGEKVDHPELFVRALYGREQGRIAYLYDTIADLDGPHAAFALGLWMKDAGVRVNRFKDLAAAARTAFPQWQPTRLPFARPLHDIASLLLRVEVEHDGSPSFPSQRAVWTWVFQSTDLMSDGPAVTRGLDDPIDAAWLARAIVFADVRARGERLDQLAFAHRVLAATDASQASELLIAVRVLPRYRMLMLALERIGVRNGAVYVSLSRRAQQLSATTERHRFVALAQFQGALALIMRMASAQTIDRESAEALVTSLGKVPLTNDGRYAGALSNWIDRELRGKLASADDLEAGMLRALAGGPTAPANGRIQWEGQVYRLDLAAAEERRLQGIREKQGGATLDMALELADVARKSIEVPATTDRVTMASETLKRIAVDLARTSSDGVRHAREIAVRTADDLSKLKTPGEAQRAAEVAAPLADLADDLLADALMGWTYALAISDADSPILLTDASTKRHEFGQSPADRGARPHSDWDLPRQVIAPGTPWRVAGSLIGLDVALSPLSLRRVDGNRVVDAPTLSTNEREAFAVSVTMLNPWLMRDRERDMAAEAIATGRRRIAALAEEASALDQIGSEIHLDGWRRRALRWTIAHDPGRIGSLFSLTELLVLGHGSVDDFHPWGMSALASSGCLCTRLAAPNTWHMLLGRPQIGFMATAVADLNLHVALMLRELQLPAAITKSVLTAAVQDLIDEVRPTDANDWLSLVREAQTASRERIEDYVSAVTAEGPLVPAAAGNASHEP
jgi:hypothetical protein